MWLVPMVACETSAEPTPIAEVDAVADTDTTDTDTERDSDTQEAIGDSAPEPCRTVAPTACPDPAPTFVQVEPIINATCVPCHFGATNGPWPLNSYEHVTDWRDTIRSAMLDCSMPPPEDDLTMSHEDRMVILTWIRCGMPRGTPAR